MSDSVSSRASGAAPTSTAATSADTQPDGQEFPHVARPEVAALTFGFLPLSDAAPIIVAHAKGWFRDAGVHSSLRREGSWTGLRDALGRGEVQAAQLLFSMPLAAACGLLGGSSQRLIVPWVLSRNGQAITLNARYRGRAGAEARALRAAAVEGRDTGRPLVFGHTLRVGTHALWLRHWLATGGIHPDRDVALITVPPAQMAANMRSGRVDGFCVGEPWNARALAEGLGFTALASSEIWPDHPEKVCAFTEDFAARQPGAVIATLQALHQASAWLDDPANHAEAVALLAQPEHLGCDPAWIAARFGAAIDYGDGRTAELTHPLTFHQRSAHEPRTAEAVWCLTQLRRWGLHYGAPDYAGLTARVIRTDLHGQALRELGVAPAVAVAAPFPPGEGGPFDPAAPEAYATGFALHHLQG